MTYAMNHKKPDLDALNLTIGSNPCSFGYFKKEFNRNNDFDKKASDPDDMPSFSMIQELLGGYPKDEHMRLAEAMWDLLDNNKKRVIIDRYTNYSNSCKVFLSYDNGLKIELSDGKECKTFVLNSSRYYTVIYVLYIMDRWSDQFTPDHSNNRLRIDSEDKGNGHYNYKQLFDDVWDFMYGYSGDSDNFLAFLGKKLGKKLSENFYSKSYSRINRQIYDIFGNRNAAPFVIGKDAHIHIKPAEIHTDTVVEKFFKAMFIRNKYPECFGKAKIFQAVTYNPQNDLAYDLNHKRFTAPMSKSWEDILKENFGGSNNKTGWKGKVQYL